MDENINVHLAEKFCDGMIFIKMGWSTREKYVVMQTVKKVGYSGETGQK